MKGKAGKRISNGHDAEGPIPWQVGLFEYHWLINYEAFKCGGSIIDEYTILTAAHCFRAKKSDGSVTMDTSPQKKYTRLILNIGLLKKSEANAKSRYEIEKIVIHPRFNPNDFDSGHDIAIIKTKNQINFTPTIQPICLPSKKDFPIGLISQLQFHFYTSPYSGHQNVIHSSSHQKTN